MAAHETLVLIGAGFAAGVMNAVAGGGVFLTFPTMISLGLPPIAAAATSAVAVWPGHAAAVPLAWKELAEPPRTWTRRCVFICAGAACGSALLLWGGDANFGRAVPWLMLLATALFGLAPRLRRAVAPPAQRPLWHDMVDFSLAVYGGYFGAALGVLLLSALSLQGQVDLRRANAIKNVLACLVLSVSVTALAVGGEVVWRFAVPTLLGALAGGAAGALLARRAPSGLMRAAVVIVGIAVTVHEFRKAWLP